MGGAGDTNPPLLAAAGTMRMSGLVSVSLDGGNEWEGKRKNEGAKAQIRRKRKQGGEEAP